MAGHRTTCMHVRMQACQRPVTAPRPPHITSNHTWLCIIEFPTMLSAASSSIRLATLRSAASSVFSLHTPACASKRASVKMASCCPPSAGPGVSYDYTPKGSFDKISSDLEAYVTGSGSSGRGILLVPGEEEFACVYCTQGYGCFISGLCMLASCWLCACACSALCTA